MWKFARWFGLLTVVFTSGCPGSLFFEITNLSSARGLEGLWTGDISYTQDVGNPCCFWDGRMELDISSHVGSSFDGLLYMEALSYTTPNPPPCDPDFFCQPAIGDLLILDVQDGRIESSRIEWDSLVTPDVCLHFKGSFTTDLMNGFRNPNDPPMRNCFPPQTTDGVVAEEWELTRDTIAF